MDGLKREGGTNSMAYLSTRGRSAENDSADPREEGRVFLPVVQERALDGS